MFCLIVLGLELFGSVLGSEIVHFSLELGWVAEEESVFILLYSVSYSVIYLYLMDEEMIKDEIISNFSQQYLSSPLTNSDHLIE
jgi:hypothetical protein